MQDLEALSRIKHFIILMLENRSFDQMLGFLSASTAMGGCERSDVDGVAKPGRHQNHYEGKTYWPETLHGNEFFLWDPCHDHESTLAQLKNGNSGFVSEFAKRAHRLYWGRPLNDYSLVMGFYSREVLSVYDRLAERFCVCDKWFSSVPGLTHPNRLYAMSGTSLGSVANTIGPNPQDTIFNVLDHCTQGGQFPWGAFFSDISSLWLFKRHRWKDPNGRIMRMREFYAKAEQGTLPSVSWIDPNFSVGSVNLGSDDHPPSSVLQG